ncbi:MAG: TPM domain-containing protein [Burkholderiales bacterium]|nr:TPM domain-containing protein [Burkholderiales bacterium]
MAEPALRRLRSWLAAPLLGLALVLGLAFPGASQAQAVLPVPALSARVIDQTGSLSPAQRAALEAKLAAFEAQAGPQIVLLLVPTTAPEDIASYGQRVADQWKLGRKQVGDGLLVVVAKNDRQVRIEVAKSLEGAVPDLAARQVIDRAFAPAFARGDFAGGLDAGVDLLIARIRGEDLPAPAARGAGAPPAVPFQQSLMFFFVGVMVVGGLLSAVLGRRLGSVLTAVASGGLAWWLGAGVLMALGAALATVLVVGVLGVGTVLQLVAMGMGRGGGGGGGGGGFSSGGGGDFGGGGASGRW